VLCNARSQRGPLSTQLHSRTLGQLVGTFAAARQVVVVELPAAGVAEPVALAGLLIQHARSVGFLGAELRWSRAWEGFGIALPQTAVTSASTAG